MEEIKVHIDEEDHVQHQASNSVVDRSSASATNGSTDHVQQPSRWNTCHKVFSIILCRWKDHVNGDDSDHHGKTKEEREAYRTLRKALAEDQASKKYRQLIIFVGQVLILVLSLVLLASTASIHKVQNESLLNLRIHRWAVLFMVVVSGLYFIQTFTDVILELIPLKSSIKLKLYTFFHVRKLKRPFEFTLWLALILLVWYGWFSHEIVHDIRGAKTLGVPVHAYTHALKIVAKQVTRLLSALTIGCLFLTMKALWYSYLKANLHYKRLCPRIRQAILDLHGIEIINEGKYCFLPNSNKRSKEEINRPVAASKEHDQMKMSFWMAVSYLTKENAPVRILKKLTDAYNKNMNSRLPKVLSDLQTANDDDEKFMEEAKKMYNKVVEDCPKDYIDYADLDKFNLQQDEIKRVFKLFTNKEDQQTISKHQFLRWAVAAFKNCLGLDNTITSSRLLFETLNTLMNIGVVVLTVVIWLLLSELVSTGQLAILFTPFVSLSVIFGESLKRTFDSVIFVFAMHPFNAGDRVIVDDVKMKVKEISLLTTVFFRYKTEDEVIYPNNDLAKKSIVNLDSDKSIADWDLVEFNVPIDTPEDLVFDLEVKIKKSLDDELTFTSHTMVAKKDISGKKVSIMVSFQYLVDYHSAEIKSLRRSKVIRMIMRLREELQYANETMEKTIKGKKEEYETQIVKFCVDRKLKLVKIQELKNKIMEILQGYESFKDYSKVIFTDFDRKEITLDVQIRRRKDDPLKTHYDIPKIKEEIVKAIEEGEARVVKEKENITP